MHLITTFCLMLTLSVASATFYNSPSGPPSPLRKTTAAQPWHSQRPHNMPSKPYSHAPVKVVRNYTPTRKPVVQSYTRYRNPAPRQSTARQQTHYPTPEPQPYRPRRVYRPRRPFRPRRTYRPQPIYRPRPVVHQYRPRIAARPWSPPMIKRRPAPRRYRPRTYRPRSVRRRAFPIYRRRMFRYRPRPQPFRPAARPWAPRATSPVTNWQGRTSRGRPVIGVTSYGRPIVAKPSVKVWSSDSSKEQIHRKPTIRTSSSSFVNRRRPFVPQGSLVVSDFRPDVPLPRNIPVPHNIPVLQGSLESSGSSSMDVSDFRADVPSPHNIPLPHNIPVPRSVPVPRNIPVGRRIPPRLPSNIFTPREQLFTHESSTSDSSLFSDQSDQSSASSEAQSHRDSFSRSLSSEDSNSESSEQFSHRRIQEASSESGSSSEQRAPRRPFPVSFSQHNLNNRPVQRLESFSKSQESSSSEERRGPIRPIPVSFRRPSPIRRPGPRPILKPTPSAPLRPAPIQPRIHTSQTTNQLNDRRNTSFTRRQSVLNGNSNSGSNSGSSEA